MIKSSYHLTILSILLSFFPPQASPIHRIPKRSDKNQLNGSSLTDIFETEKTFRFNAFANRKFQESLTQNLDTFNKINRKPNVFLNIQTTTVGTKLNRKSRHKIQSSGKSFKKFTGIFIPVPASKKPFDSLLLTSPKPETTKDSFMEFYYWGDIGKNKVRELKNVTNRNTSDIQKSKENKDRNHNVHSVLSFTAWEKKEDNLEKHPELPAYYGFRLGFTKPTSSKFVTDQSFFPTYFNNPNSTAKNGSTFRRDDSTAYDKIKFFETYDVGATEDYNVINEMPRITTMPQRLPILHNSPKTNMILPNVSITESNNQETPDFDFDISVYDDDNNTRFVVKDATPLKTSNNIVYEQTSKANRILSVLYNPQKTTSKLVNVNKLSTENRSKKNDTIKSLKNKRNLSKEVLCSKYPFVAAYVYEPLQVFCDAASVSRYWLITSASCLSRKDKGIVKRPQWAQERSAFVSYCSENWWDPHSITYVKNSKIHPQFDQHDKSGQYLYNIGLILVVNAMSSSCIFWSPVSMLSRRFVTKSEGHEAIAVGWGLDRYDTKSSDDVPKHHLSVYTGTAFSNACPGNFGYSKFKSVMEPEILENIYCLSLPPYFGEESDQLHGSLLLLESGQLIGLYLGEERRRFGPQSAQYIGVWKHASWIMDNSKDPEDIDNIQIDII